MKARGHRATARAWSVGRCRCTRRGRTAAPWLRLRDLRKRVHRRDTKWSPTVVHRVTAQSMCASVPPITGEPSAEGLQSIPPNLSGSFDPNRPRRLLILVRKLTQNLPLASIRCHDRDIWRAEHTSGGSRAAPRTGWQANPMGGLPVALSDIDPCDVGVCPIAETGQARGGTWRGSIGQAYRAT